MEIRVKKLTLSPPLSESHQQGIGLGTIITIALFVISYKDFFDCFETYPVLRAPLSERGG